MGGLKYVSPVVTQMLFGRHDGGCSEDYEADEVAEE